MAHSLGKLSCMSGGSDAAILPSIIPPKGSRVSQGWPKKSFQKDRCTPQAIILPVSAAWRTLLTSPLVKRRPVGLQPTHLMGALLPTRSVLLRSGQNRPSTISIMARSPSATHPKVLSIIIGLKGAGTSPATREPAGERPRTAVRSQVGRPGRGVCFPRPGSRGRQLSPKRAANTNRTAA